MTEELSPGRDKPLLLVVDDDPALGRLLQMLAEDLNIDVELATSCRQAMLLLKSTAYDALLMDWRMPDIDGCECTRLIRESEAASTERIPIIAVTAYNRPGDRENCLAAGMDDFIAKPFTLEQLQEVLLRWCNKVSAPKPVSEVS